MRKSVLIESQPHYPLGQSHDDWGAKGLPNRGFVTCKIGDSINQSHILQEVAFFSNRK